jgi:DNA polymerase/3'-5' exonuclease PolX
VESGKVCAKAGPKKVKGIGAGIGEKIDQFLETGTMTRITELEGAAEAV